jgi:hypothetical protein
MLPKRKGTVISHNKTIKSKNGALKKERGCMMQQSCFKCRHFFITWDPQNPRGCRAYQFKSKAIPSIIVKNSSGMDCLKFEPKVRGNVQ